VGGARGLEVGGVKVLGFDLSPTIAIGSGLIVVLVGIAFIPIAYYHEAASLPLDLVAGKTIESHEFEIKDDRLRYTFFIRFDRIDSVVSPQLLFCRSGIESRQCPANTDATLALAWHLTENGVVIRSGTESGTNWGGASSNSDFRRYFSGDNIGFYGAKGKKYKVIVQVMRDGEELKLTAPRLVVAACYDWYSVYLRYSRSDYQNRLC
jgi:hypothetical protein